ncbi:MAG: aminopeptidase P family protein [Paludibacteraceae bacterium]|nr:aminopeptidase P family protein [Paludibacteraceae bacterium]
MIQNNLLNDLCIKWACMQHEMQQMDADGCLLTINVNLYYTTGRVFNGYFYLPSEGEPYFFVKRPNGFEGNQVFYIRKPEQMPELFTEIGLKLPKKLLLEADELTYSEYVRIQSIFKPKETPNATALMRKLRRIKTPFEIEQFRISAQQHAKTYAEIPSCFRMGMTDVQLQIEIERLMRLNGSLGMFRAFGANMDLFMGSLLAGDNAEEPSPFDYALGGNGIDTSCPLGANGTVLKKGFSIMVDMAGNYTPYMTDMTRVYSVGKLTDLAYRAHQASLTIQNEIENIARPGTSCAELYNLALQITEAEGLGQYFMGTKQQAKFIGHGVGLQINELPVLTPRSKELLETNMIFALEPKYVIPGVGAVGIENSFLVTENGLEKITQFEEEIIEF